MRCISVISWEKNSLKCVSFSQMALPPPPCSPSLPPCLPPCLPAPPFPSSARSPLCSLSNVTLFDTQGWGPGRICKGRGSGPVRRLLYHLFNPRPLLTGKSSPPQNCLSLSFSVSLQRRGRLFPEVVCSGRPPVWMQHMRTFEHILGHAFNVFFFFLRNQKSKLVQIAQTD